MPTQVMVKSSQVVQGQRHARMLPAMDGLGKFQATSGNRLGFTKAACFPENESQVVQRTSDAREVLWCFGFVNRQAASKQSLGFSMAAQGVADAADAVQAPGHVWMFRPKGALADPECSTRCCLG